MNKDVIQTDTAYIVKSEIIAISKHGTGAEIHFRGGGSVVVPESIAELYDLLLASAEELMIKALARPVASADQ